MLSYEATYLELRTRCGKYCTGGSKDVVGTVSISSFNNIHHWAIIGQVTADQGCPMKQIGGDVEDNENCEEKSEPGAYGRLGALPYYQQHLYEALPNIDHSASRKLAIAPVPLCDTFVI